MSKKIHSIKYLILSSTSLVICLLIATISMHINPTFAYSNEIYYGDSNYADNGNSSTQYETFTYSYKQSNKVLINNSFPQYYNTNNSLTNTCANVAGCNILGYYDKTYTNLIPDYTPGIQRPSGYIYYAMSYNTQKKQNIIDDLYVRMSTNNPNSGTTQTQYKNGLSSYIINQGYTATYSSIMTNNIIDMTKLTTAISNGTPISLFLSGYNFSIISDNNNVVLITKYIFTGNHIAIIYGYQIVDYYDDSDSIICTKTYLYVATGMELVSGVYILNNNGTINDAESISINT